MRYTSIDFEADIQNVVYLLQHTKANAFIFEFGDYYKVSMGYGSGKYQFDVFEKASREVFFTCESQFLFTREIFKKIKKAIEAYEQEDPCKGCIDRSCEYSYCKFR